MQSAPAARPTGRAPGTEAAGVLSAVLRPYRELESTPWGRLLFGNVWPAYLFALPLGVRLWGFLQRLASPEGLLPAAAADPLRARAALAQEVVTILFLLLVVILFAVRRPVLGRRADWGGALVALIGTFLLNVVGFLPVPGDTGTEALLASTAVIVGGTLFTTWSLAVLGRCFGLFPEARGLVTRGPYRWVRHPVYLGEIVSAFGIVIAKPHPITVTFYALFVLFQVWRAHLEEGALASAFPEDYPAYRARTGRLWPSF